MRRLALSATAIAFLCSSAAIAAPIPSGVSGIGQAALGDIVQVKTKKKKRMKKSKAMSGGSGSMGAQPAVGAGAGTSGQPMQGGSAGAGQPGAMPQKTQ